MADIRSYMKEKEKREKREKKQTDYKEKIARHKLASVYRVILILVLLAAFAVFLVVQYRRRTYTDYNTIATIPRESVSGATDVKLGSAILTYSKDGAHCTDSRGSVTWNQTFEIQDVILARNRGTVAIGEYNGRSIYLADSEKLLGEITTAMPVRQLSVSGILRTKIAFYNFGRVGENYSDGLVSSYVLTDTVVPYVGFLNDETAFSVGDNRLTIYSGGYVPEEAAGHLYDREIRSVFYGDRYIGLVFLSDNNENRYQLKVYDTESDKAKDFYFDMDYTDIFFGRDNFVIYNEAECQIMTMGGTEKFRGSFSKTVRLMAPVGNTYKYMLVTDDSIDTIQLK